MKNEEFQNILEEQKNLKDLPNTKLVEFMDLLSSDFFFVTALRWDGPSYNF